MHKTWVLIAMLLLYWYVHTLTVTISMCATDHTCIYIRKYNISNTYDMCLATVLAIALACVCMQHSN